MTINRIVSSIMGVWFILGSHWAYAATNDEISLRGTRYCEIVCLHNNEIAVYDTLHLNNCPDTQWRKLSAETIKQATHSVYVYLNGPRRFTADGVKHPHYLDPKPRKFRDLMMHKVGILHPTVHDYIFGDAAYREHHVHRNTTWIYAAGKPVYELVDPHGQVYVMYSYSVTQSQQSEQDLSHLGQRMKLPKNWQFKTGTLQQETLVRPIHHEAIVVQDTRRNAYHKVAQDLL